MLGSGEELSQNLPVRHCVSRVTGIPSRVCNSSHMSWGRVLYVNNRRGSSGRRGGDDGLQRVADSPMASPYALAASRYDPSDNSRLASWTICCAVRSPSTGVRADSASTKEKIRPSVGLILIFPTVLNRPFTRKNLYKFVVRGYVVTS